MIISKAAVTKKLHRALCLILILMFLSSLTPVKVSAIDSTESAPTVLGISPSSGSIAGGTTVTITGTGFTSVTAVTFGSAAAASFSGVSATQITAVSPSGTGAVDVTVTTANGTSAISTADQFTYQTGVLLAANNNMTAYALKPDGTVWAWGFNDVGELGNGSAAKSSVPVQVSGLTSTVAVAGGGYSGYALESDGTVYAWGENRYGRLGNNSTTNSLTPVQVCDLTGTSYLTGVTAIAAGYSAGYALKSDGTVQAWGYNYFGQ